MAAPMSNTGEPMVPPWTPSFTGAYGPALPGSPGKARLRPPAQALDPARRASGASWPPPCLTRGNPWFPRGPPPSQEPMAQRFPARRAKPGSALPRKRSIRLEELLELHGRPHVALDLQLAGHVGRRRILLAARDLRERLLGGRDRGVGAARVALGHLHGPVVDGDRPLLPVDVEQVRIRHPGRLRLVDPGLETPEELPRACRHHASL